ncbi:response regulator [Deltaproteobacteria bacterium TL4]
MEQKPEIQHQLPATKSGVPVQKLGERLPLRILVAEDNRINQVLVIALLEELGYIADMASNGREVMDSLKRQDYDIILMDVQMPELDGFETTRHILDKWPEARRPKIIAVTANALQGDKERCLEAGMNDYLSKPIMENELISVLTRWGQQIGAYSVLQKEILEREIINKQIFSALNPVLRKELIKIFLQQAPLSIEQIKTHIEHEDFRNLSLDAHDLKGSCLALRASQMAMICEVLQKKGEHQDLSEIPTLMKLLEDNFSLLRKELKTY